jgi:transglutaminase-like putative cysteine protease
MANSLTPAHPLTPAQTWWLLATGLAASAPLVQHVPLWLSALTGAAFLWRAALLWWHQPLPNRWLLGFVTLVGTAAVLLEYRTLFGQRAGVALLLIFLALKQLEARAPRDGLTIVLLAYFLTLTQFFEDQSITVAITLLGTLVIATAALASLTDAQARPLGLLRLAGLMLAQALPFMLVLFVLFPRISGPLWGLPSDAHSGLTGLSDNMSPGAINNLIQSDAIAFRAKFAGPVPSKPELYWRGPVLTHLDGRTWRPGIQSLGTRMAYQAEPEGNSPVYAYAITLEPHNKPWLFALELPTILPETALLTSDFQLHAKKPVRERIRYELQSQAAVRHTPENPRVLAQALALPAALNPRTQALGAEWQQHGGSDAQRLQHAIDFMRAQAFIYTLQPPLMSEHVADAFLFDHKRGFCEHFAASFVVLMRATGLPARVVTGYQGGERNPVDDTWVIRQSDAHAWAEVWLAQRGWLRVDPTALSAPARIEINLAAAVPAGEPLPFLSGTGLDWLRDARFRWWAISDAWNQWVLGYNPERQRDFLKKLGMRSPDWRSMGVTLAVLCGLLLLVLAGWMLYHRPQRDPVERQWHKLSRQLAHHEKGLARHSWEGPHDYVGRVATAMPARATELAAIANLYATLRYSKASLVNLKELRRRVAAFTP